MDSVYNESVGKEFVYKQAVVELSGSDEKPSASDANHLSADSEYTTPHENMPAKRSGRWTMDEKILFLYGLRRFGKGRWKKISIYLPGRSLVQIKSHAQKVLKRMDAGENVFRRLHESSSRTDALVQSIHLKYGLDSPEWWRLCANGGSNNNNNNSVNKRKVQDASAPSDVAEQFDAASALCQLSSSTTPTCKAIASPTSCATILLKEKDVGYAIRTKT